MHISPFSNFDELTNTDDLLDAAKTLFNPALGLSPDVVRSQCDNLKEAAKRLGCYEEIIAAMFELSKNSSPSRFDGFDGLSTSDQESLMDCRNECTLDRYGNIECTVGNYLKIMQRDPLFETLKQNNLTLRAEFSDGKGNVHKWDDAHDAEGRGRIEELYGLYNVRKYDDAFKRFLLRNNYHPLKEALERTKWDGVTRIPYLLTKWMKAEDNDYTREVSRLIFAGGIHRLYHPGCKFDDMPVLIGDQGAGKSTFVRWLAIEDRFFKELTSTKDKEGGELVEGSWVMEVSELLALTRTKEQEEVKAFLSRQVDCFRAAYGKFVGDRPRTCIFIGTSNREQFITDKTGGRRFYPVHCKSTGHDLFDHEEECREYIRQCWAEALAKIDTDFMAPYAKREILPFIQKMQENAAEDDYRVDMIQAYLEAHKGDSICTVTLWKEALSIDNKEPTRAEQIQIGLIMKKMSDWERVERRQRTKYGQKRYWIYKGKQNVPTYDTPNDDIPF